MGKILSFLLVVLALLLSAQSVDSHEFPFAGVDAYQALLRAGHTTLERFAAALVPSRIPLLADGGGDGGGGSGDGGGGSGDGGGTGTGGETGDGGSGAGAAGGTGTGGAGDGTGGTGDGTGGNGDGTGDSSSAADAAAATSDAAASTDAAATDAAATDASAATDAAATDAAATDEAAVDNTAVTAVTTDPAISPDAVAPPTDPTTVNNDVTPELAAIMSIPTTDPRGGEDVSPAVTNGVPGGAAPALGGPVAAPVDVAINAVIVSAAQSPWDAIRRAPGVRNVIVTGGIIALGKTRIPGEIPGGGPQPAWLRLIPDLRLLNGSAIPPVVPNVIDVRIMNCPIKIENLPE